MTTAPSTARSRLSTGLALTVLLGFVVCLLGSSMKNTVQVFFEPMAGSFGEARGTFAIATTVFAITYAVAAPLTGMLADRIGPTRVLTVGTALGGAALLLCGATSSFPLLVAVYGICASFAYAMLSYVPIGVLVDRLFKDGRKGFVYALLTNGTAAGFMLLVPLWSWLEHYTVWRRVFEGLGVLLLVAITPLTLLLSRNAPARSPGADGTVLTARQRWRLVLRSNVLWRLAGALFACGATMAFIDVHMMAYLSDNHISKGVSSGCMVLLGGCEIVGSLVAGRLCDRSMVKSVLISGYLVRGAAMFLLAVHPSTASLMVFGVVFGSSYLVTVVATTVWIMRVFPVEVKGVAMGMIWTVHQIGAALTSQLGGVVYDREHSYVPVIIATGLIALVAAFVVATISSPDRGGTTVPLPKTAEAAA